jgi:hypothetical protein
LTSKILQKFRNETAEIEREQEARFSNEFFENYRSDAFKLYNEIMAALAQIGIIPPRTGMELLLPPDFSSMDMLVSGPTARFVDDNRITQVIDKLDSLAARFPDQDQPRPSTNPQAALPPYPAPSK